MTWEDFDKLDLKKITEDQVVEAFKESLRFDVRLMKLDGETGFCRETAAQTEERTEASAVFETLKLNYVANHVR